MIAFIDLAAQQRRLGGRIEAAIARVMAHGGYIMGPEVRELEAGLAQFGGARHALTCANGTDALSLVLMAWGIGPGDAVVVPSFTFVATAEAVALRGAVPVFADVRADDFNLCPLSAEAAIDRAVALGLTPRVLIAVDLFGQPADYPALRQVADRHGMRLLADAAQGFGGAMGDSMVGNLADATTVSFFPAKPLGCYGDGGAVLTDDDSLAEVLESLRVHGKGRDKYDNVAIGVNSRLDTIQAAVLLEKLAIFSEELESRQRVAERYSARLASLVQVPHLRPGNRSAWAQYTLVTPHRDAVAASCKAASVPTAVYYPIPLHRQTGYRHFPTANGGCPNSERLADSVISLPMHPYLDEETIDRVCDAVAQAFKS